MLRTRDDCVMTAVDGRSPFHATAVSFNAGLPRAVNCFLQIVDNPRDAALIPE
jgi:hypothetical protein